VGRKDNQTSRGKAKKGNQKVRTQLLDHAKKGGEAVIGTGRKKKRPNGGRKGGLLMLV